MAIYDEEMVIRDLLALFKASLNTEIAGVNTEKNDSMVLAVIPSDAYTYEGMKMNAILNYEGFFVMYSLVDTPVEDTIEGNAVESCIVSFEVGTIVTAELVPEDVIYRLLRYRKAIKNLVMKNLDVFQGYSSLKMASLKPNALPLDGNLAIIKAGVDITASLTAF